MLTVLLNIIWALLSVFMILVILVQRGRGGGLAGALSGAGGSAFGTRAGDVFTRITVVVFMIWLVVAMILSRSMATHPELYQGGSNVDKPDAKMGPEVPGTEAEKKAGEVDLDTNLPLPPTKKADADAKKADADAKRESKSEEPPAADKKPDSKDETKSDPTPQPNESKDGKPKADAPADAEKAKPEAKKTDAKD